MSRNLVADKENQRERNVALRAATGEASHKTFGGVGRKDPIQNNEKSARVLAKKDVLKTLPSSGAGIAQNIQSIKKTQQMLSKGEDTPKDAMHAKKPTFANLMPKTSILSAYLGKEREMRARSKGKAGREEESKNKPPVEKLQHSKSILQYAGLHPKVQNLLNHSKKEKRQKDNADMSSHSILSEVSDISRCTRQQESRAVDLVAYRSTDKTNLGQKEKTGFFGKKIENTCRLGSSKQNLGSMGKSRQLGSVSSQETTPEKISSMAERITSLQGLSKNIKSFKQKENSTLGQPLGVKALKAKKERLLCLENLVVKTEGVQGRLGNNASGTALHLEGGFLSKGPLPAKRKEPKIEREPTPEEEIAAFEKEWKQDQGNYSDILSHMIKAEPDYAPDPYYLEKNHPDITWLMRAMLLDWLAEVCYTYGQKISTFQMAVNNVDRFMSATQNIPKSCFQLVGLAAFIVAAKIEEVYVIDLALLSLVASNAFSIDNIKKYEQHMIKTLKWRLNPPTHQAWSNWYTVQWDKFLIESPECKSHPLLLAQGNQPKVVFRQTHLESYMRYRELMQLIDCALLDSQTLQYKMRPLVVAFMYIILGKDFGQFTLDLIVETFPQSSHYLLDKDFAFNNLFSLFMNKYCTFQLEDLLPSIQFASTFFKLQLTQEWPIPVKQNPKPMADWHFEDFLAYQVHNPNSLDFVTTKRKRNLF